MPTKIQVRRGTASEWTTANPVLSSGEFGYETDSAKFKIGDGSTAWASLAYSTATLAPLASPALTGTPTAPTAAVTTNTTQIATTAFVNAEISNDAVLKSLLTAKGQLVGASASGTPVAIAAGTDTYVLTADSTQASGVKWAVTSGGVGFDAVFMLMGA